jgi:hypothetical protein
MSAVLKYEVRRHSVRGYDDAYEVYELPSKAAPYLHEPRRLGGLAGANLALVEKVLMRRLKRIGVRFENGRRDGVAHATISEDEALRLALLFRAVAPMRSRARIDAVIRGLESMGKEEAAYWLGMAVHRKTPRRILSALRIVAAEDDLR